MILPQWCFCTKKQSNRKKACKEHLHVKELTTQLLLSQTVLASIGKPS